MKAKGISESEKPRKITMDDCVEAIKRRKSVTSSEEIRKFEEWNKEHGAG
jgi:hypothetical protein